MKPLVCKIGLVVGLCVPTFLFAQEASEPGSVPVVTPENRQASPASPPKARQKIYQSPNGELYMQPDQKLYFNVSGSENGPTFLMQSKAGLIQKLRKKPVRPFQFKDGEGRHTLVHPSGEGNYWSGRKKLESVNDENIFYFHLDGQAPRTRVKSKGAVRAGTSKGIYYGGPVRLILSATDTKAKLQSNVSGLQEVFFSVDGRSFESYKSPVSFEGERLHQIRYYGVDHVGNQEELHSFQFRIDTTAPNSLIKYKGIESGEYLASSTRIFFQGFDKDSGLKQVHYKISGPKKIAGLYRGPISLKKWPDGAYQVRYRATDKVRNHQAEQTASFYLDTKAPRLSIKTEGPGFWSKQTLYVASASKIELIAKDQSSGVAWVKYKIGKKSKRYQGPIAVPRKAGSFVVKAWAGDKVRNQSRVYKYKLVMDPNAPQSKYRFVGPQFSGSKGKFISAKTMIKLTSSDKASGVQHKYYQLDAQGDEQYKRPFAVPTAGEHRLGYYGKDQVGNTERANHVNFIVDTEAPNIETKFSVGSMGEDVYPRGSLLFVIGSDRASGLQKILISINGSKPTLYERPPRLNKKGRYKVSLQAYDRVGNRSDAKLQFTVR